MITDEELDGIIEDAIWDSTCYSITGFDSYNIHNDDPRYDSVADFVCDAVYNCILMSVRNSAWESLSKKLR